MVRAAQPQPSHNDVAAALKDCRGAFGGVALFLVGAYAFQGVLDLIRSRIIVRAAALLDRRLGTTVHHAVVRLATRSRNPAEAHQPVRDLDQIRAFLTSPGPTAIVDLPWMPVF